MPKKSSLEGPQFDLTSPDVGLVDIDDARVEEATDADPVDAAVDSIVAYKTAFQQRAKTEQARLTLSTDSEFWVCVCFETRQQKETFLARMQLADLGDKHIDGIEVARRLGVPFSGTERVKWPKRRGAGGLAKLSE